MKRLAYGLVFGLVVGLLSAGGFARLASAKSMGAKPVAAKDIVCGWRMGADGYTHFACHIAGKPGAPTVAVRIEDVTPTQAIVQLVARIVRGSDVDPKLVLAVIAAESAFDRHAVSPKNALGLMQLMPETVARYGVRDPFDAEENIRAGASYLQFLLRKYGDLRLALAAYNAGEGPVLSYGAVPPYEETTEYVARVLRLYARYQGVPAERRAPVQIVAKAAPVKPAAAKPVAARAKTTRGCDAVCHLAAQIDAVAPPSPALMSARAN